jgi:RecA-family ATPase
MSTDSKYINPLDQRRICPSDNITKDQAIFYMKGDIEYTEVFTKGNISTIIGKAKGRKTFFLSLLIAAMKGLREEQFKSDVDGKIVLFDTEQAKYHVWKATKRIEDMLTIWPPTIEVFGLRPDATSERVSLIESYIYQQEPQVVFIDGIRDLITDINDATQATEIVGKLMKWSYEKQCHICCVLHQNKADENARGHIGTEIVNKSETVISINKVISDTYYSEVKSLYTRGHEIREFTFSIQGGLPVVKHEESKLFERQYKPEKEEAPF